MLLAREDERARERGALNSPARSDLFVKIRDLEHELNQCMLVVYKNVNLHRLINNMLTHRQSYHRSVRPTKNGKCSIDL